MTKTILNSKTRLYKSRDHDRPWYKRRNMISKKLWCYLAIIKQNLFGNFKIIHHNMFSFRLTFGLEISVCATYTCKKGNNIELLHLILQELSILTTRLSITFEVSKVGLFSNFTALCS